MSRLLSLTLLLMSFLAVITSKGAITESTKTKTAVILVHGAFGSASVWDQVKTRLSNFAYDVEAVQLPSVGKNAANLERTADIKVVQKAIRKRVHQGRGGGQNVILVGNSYGATVIGDAVKDFEKLSSVSPAAPAQGKILGLIMLSGFIPYITEVTTQDHLDIRLISPSWFRFQGTSLVYWDNDLKNYPPSVTLFTLLEKDAAASTVSSLAPSSFVALNATAQYIPYTGTFRCLYVVGAHDNAVPAALSQSYIDQPGAKFEVLTIDGDHEPQLCRPDTVVQVIRRFIGEKIYKIDGQVWMS
ncbi:alpha/beta-hydrolase [Setomelanomma holmii]|uniref:Alpha/beta-hydrolase n=1 Tax=Setomelanomma holmii TaxID=210430 RepID=A0A9P4H527_9PLEO|nr:alpha/beta-hydrolase [Setomelanomma holmii]